MINGPSFEPNDPILIGSSQVWPVENPSETYPYSSLPHCHNPNNDNHNTTYRFELSTKSWLPPVHSEPTGFPIRFQEQVEKNRVLCRKTISPKDWKALCEAVRNKYAIEFDVVVSPFETLPTLALVGTVLLDEIHLNHLAFSLGYSVPQNEIVWAEVATHPTINITEFPLQPIDLTFSVSFFESDHSWSDRYEKYKGPPLGREQPALVIVVFLVSVLAFMSVLPALIRSHHQDNNDDEEEESNEGSTEEQGEEQGGGDATVRLLAPETSAGKQTAIGWRQQTIVLLCSLVATGMQLLVTAVACFVGIGVLGGSMVNCSRFVLMRAAWMFYCGCTMFLGGYTAVWLSTILVGEEEGDFGNSNAATTTTTTTTKCLLWICAIFPLPLGLVGLVVVNSVALYYKVTTVLPLEGFVQIAALYLCLGVPLACLGACLASRHHASSAKWLASTTAGVTAPLETHHQKTWRVLALLPLPAVCNHLNLILSVIWKYERHSNLGERLVLATAMVLAANAVCTVLTLPVCGHHKEEGGRGGRCLWTIWTNSGGLSGLATLLYTVYFYFYNSSMSGTLQTTFYFGYSTLLCWAYALVMGSNSVVASLWFVRFLQGQAHKNK